MMQFFPERTPVRYGDGNYTAIGIASLVVQNQNGGHATKTDRQLVYADLIVINKHGELLTIPAEGAEFTAWAAWT